jgi:1,4-dihydroxy-2-naphthoate octaprenyltransferase
MKTDFWQGFWRLADPKISLASFASMFLGGCAAAADGAIDFFWLAVTVLGIFAIEVAKNASGDIFDFDTGNDEAVRLEDRTPFSGGKRVLVDKILTRNQTASIAIVCYALGIWAGLSIVFWRESSVLWMGAFGIGLAYFFHAPPIKLSYRGLGELAVAIAYGPLICIGTYLVQRGEVTIEIMLASILLGMLIGCFLLFNEFPDYYADQIVDKRTLVVRLGRHLTSQLYKGVLAFTFLTLFVLPLFGFPYAICLLSRKSIIKES